MIEMSGGVNNDSQVIAYTVVSAVPYAGMLVKGTTADATVDLCGASTGDTNEPLGYTYTSSRDNFMLYTQNGGTAAANMKIGIHALIEGQKFNAVVDATSAAIAIGDKICVDATGYITKYTSGAGWVVGIAQSALAENAGIGNTVVVRISKRYMTA